jgi:ornithine carbamoyltransferase
MAPKRQRSSAPRHFLDLDALDARTLRTILDMAHAMKKAGKRVPAKLKPPGIADNVLAMIFEKPSTRTRVSFDVAMRQLGGQTLSLSHTDLQLGRGESISDTARVLSRYVDAIMIRILDHDDLLELAGASAVPVINGLTRRDHPCQILADIMTYEEHRGPIAGRKVAWVGDSNNVMTSWVHATARFGNSLVIACPEEFEPDQAMRADIRKAGSGVRLTEDPVEAVRDADLVITDTWVSMGDTDASERRKVLKPYRVDTTLMRRAKADALFMHCLPAHRGDEVTDEVIDGPQSVVFDEAENRLHIQKAILCWCFGIERL